MALYLIFASLEIDGWIQPSIQYHVTFSGSLERMHNNTGRCVNCKTYADYDYEGTSKGNTMGLSPSPLNSL